MSVVALKVPTGRVPAQCAHTFAPDQPLASRAISSKKPSMSARYGSIISSPITDSSPSDSVMAQKTAA
jgi:hypothetical protein